MNIRWIGAHQNNFAVGRAGKKPEIVVVHWIVGTLASADATFQNPKRQVSAHYGVGQTEAHQYVKELDTAYHAGNLTVNRTSIGIEHEGGPNLPITDAVYRNSAWLINQIWKRYGKLPLRAHREFKQTACPGTLDLNRLKSMAEALDNPPPPPQDNNMKFELFSQKTGDNGRVYFRTWNNVLTWIPSAEDFELYFGKDAWDKIQVVDDITKVGIRFYYQNELGISLINYNSSNPPYLGSQKGTKWK